MLCGALAFSSRVYIVLRQYLFGADLDLLRLPRPHRQSTPPPAGTARSLLSGAFSVSIFREHARQDATLRDARHDL